MNGRRPSHRNFRTNLDYKRETTPSTKKMSWVGSSEGRGLKLIIGLIGDEMSGGIEAALTREFPPASEIYNRVLSRVPWIVDWYQAHRPLDEEIVYNRYHKMYYENEAPTRDGRGSISREHYTRDMRLAPYVGKVEELLRRGGVITKEQLVGAMQ